MSDSAKMLPDVMDLVMMGFAASDAASAVRQVRRGGTAERTRKTHGRANAHRQQVGRTLESTACMHMWSGVAHRRCRAQRGRARQRLRVAGAPWRPVVEPVRSAAAARPLRTGGAALRRLPSLRGHVLERDTHTRWAATHTCVACRPPPRPD
eukprot:2940344-Prymnesium_polylepis.1